MYRFPTLLPDKRKRKKIIYLATVDMELPYCDTFDQHPTDDQVLEAFADSIINDGENVKKIFCVTVKKITR